MPLFPEILVDRDDALARHHEARGGAAEEAAHLAEAARAGDEDALPDEPAGRRPGGRMRPTLS